MDFVSVKELSENWGITARRVQQYCAEGKIPGAKRVGKVWIIPGEAQRPNGKEVKLYPQFSLIDSVSFYPGESDNVVLQAESEQDSKIMKCELAYLRCEFGGAIKMYHKGMPSDPFRLCIMAVAAGEAITTGNFKACREIFREFFSLKDHCQSGCMEKNMVQLAEHMFLSKMGAVSQELVLKNGRMLSQSSRQCLHLSNGVYHYQCKNYQKVIGIMETLLSYQNDNRYTPKDLSAHLLCGLAYYKENDTKNAVCYIDRALDLALPDGLLMPFVDFLNDYGKLLEERIRERCQTSYERVVQVCQESWNNWIYIHNLYMGAHYSIVLSRRERQIALMAADGSTNREIAGKMGYSVATVKKHLESVYEKLGINKRQNLKEYII